jgi:hypothetical protein
MKTNPRTYAAIASAAYLMSLLSFAPTARAEVVYTPVNVTISGNGSIKLDLNHDKTKDFVLRSVSQVTICGNRGGFIGSTKITPTKGNGVVVSHLDFAAVLESGVSIDSSQTFYNAKTVVTQFFICTSGTQHITGYLGLEFQINGQTHYGWAQVDIYAHYNYRSSGMSTTLIDFAYESIPGQAIQTGQTSGTFDDARSIPKSVRPDSVNRLADDPRGAF